MTKKLTNNEFIKRINDILPNIIILEEYELSQKRINVSCKNHPHYFWYPIANNLLMGYGCKYCAAKNKKNCQSLSQEEFLIKLFSINKNIEVLGKYINNHVPIMVKCKIDNYIWYPRPSDILMGKGCHFCAKEKIKEKNILSQKEFINRISILSPELNILGKHLGQKKRILCECKNCNYIWNPFSGDLLAGTSCPKCKASKGEKRIIKFLEEKLIEYNHQHKFDGCKNKAPLIFDFYLPKYNVCVEYDGELHYEIHRYIKKAIAERKLKETKIRDKIKDKYCQENNIKLVRIPYWNFNNIEEILTNIF